MSNSNKTNNNNNNQQEDEHTESVEVLRERLNTMKRLISERQANNNDLWASNHYRNKNVGIIDGNFLSLAFAGALFVILCVAVYAFYNLYHAILKKFPSQHTEL
uniref:Putative conserved plasma membrane protein n=1 Tax=Corethrella appendiculata TaxID=1370023 RepID=U5ELE6_9DIPT